MTDQIQKQTLEAIRLEKLWSSEFGDAYVERNRAAGNNREPFWQKVLAEFGAQTVLEVGCNIGANLHWIAALRPPQQVYGVDINLKALNELRRTMPDVNAIWSPGRELPFRDRWFDLVFTIGVLIHQPESTLPLVMAEIVRCSRRYVLCGEYFAEQTIEVPYRNQSGALFKRNYGRIYQELFPELRLIQRSFLGRDEGWDDVTYWMFEKV
ncbi:MAG: pseudaminic acid biosynthesis-associated methylase [Candidatus Aminicenantales bacterium]